ncbi:MAG TPA: PBP1A family penicillin-binding protein [Vicinamibacterales bacterium]|nr:PBP1A family penicillin-binding protein [Vicinamibacterales bacterium]
MRSRLIRSLGIVALFVAAALLGTASGVVFAFMDDLPQISQLDDFSPSTITRVYGRDGSLVGDFATERRLVIAYEQIPDVLRQAVVAAEDGDFFSHSGVSPRRILVTYVRRLFGGIGGASTLTQQLARQLFLTNEQTWERKIKEAILAIQIEKRYTKEEILTMYCNKIYWGHGAYGVEAASQLYFGKHVSELNLDEAAMIAGIIQGNRRQSPYENMDAAVRRRNYTLGRMTAEGFISPEAAAEARARPIVTGGQAAPLPSLAPYFLELVRQHLEERYGSQAVYESGLAVRTGLDPELQRAANRSLDAGLRRVDKLRGFRKPARNLVAEGVDLMGTPRWSGEPEAGDIRPVVALNVDGTVLRVRAGEWIGTIDRAGYRWTRRAASALTARGDLLDVRVLTVDAEARTFTAELEQAPELQGAVVALDNHTGEILALVGGSSFDRSQFNRATQALRQVGSLFKPFVYATAIDRGYTAATLIDDSPTSFDAGPDQPPYEPQNYDREYRGFITLREALEGSRNVPTIRLMDALGPAQVTDLARRFGLTTPLPPFLSVAIGSAEGTLLEMTSAYTAWPNQGVRARPLLLLDVTDREGNMLEQHRAEPREAIGADTAYIITSLLEGATRRGTAASAQRLNWTIGGKTGTTDDYTDAWFIGFDPDITLGVWVGYDQKRPIGPGQTGTAAALPIWINIMKSWVDRRRAELKTPPAFPRPGNIVFAPTEKGLEVFLAGTEPGGRY